MMASASLRNTVLVAVFLCAPPALAQETAAEFFRKDRERATASGAARARSPVAAVSRSGGAVAAGSLFAASASRHGVPVNIALAVIRLESGGRCDARGRHGELGPLQIKPATARGLGYGGPTSALATCGAGLEWGMRHLALAYRKCGHPGPHNYGLGGSCRRTAYVQKIARLAHR